MRKREFGPAPVILAFLILSTLSLSMVFAVWFYATRNSDQYCPAYIFWKLGIAPYTDRVEGGMFFDSPVGDRFKDRSLKQVQRRFGNRFVPDPGATTSPAHGTFRIPHSWVGCRFEKGKCVALGIFKG